MCLISPSSSGCCLCLAHSRGSLNGWINDSSSYRDCLQYWDLPLKYDGLFYLLVWGEDLLPGGRWDEVERHPHRTRVCGGGREGEGKCGETSELCFLIFQLCDDQLLTIPTSWYTCPYVTFSPCVWAGSSDSSEQNIAPGMPLLKLGYKRLWLLSCLKHFSLALLLLLWWSKL